MDNSKPARLNALTGLRCFAALNIVFFHFSNPQWFGFLAPVVNAGFASVSFFILLSGFVLAYNYAAKARDGQLDHTRFWEARFTRLYPIYLLSLILSWRMIPLEYAAHTHAMFWTGMVLSPLLLQGWIPSIATFLNTPAWTMSAESPSISSFLGWPAGSAPSPSPPTCSRWLASGVSAWSPASLYIVFNPDGIASPTAGAGAPGCKPSSTRPCPIWPVSSSASCWPHLTSWSAAPAASASFSASSASLPPSACLLGPLVPYPVVHDGLLMPLFGCIILGLAGNNPLSWVLSRPPLVFVGEASYCLYLLHFNFWNLIHDYHVLDRLGLARFDPWISYVILIAMALTALHFVEKPAQRLLRSWMHVWR